MTEATSTILCVDDEVNILKALNRLLRRAGYQVLTAESGENGLEILKTESVDLIISDQRMPGMQGNEFLRLSRKICPDAVRIMLTAYADIKAATAAINQGGIFKFILKPWGDDELLEVIKDGLNQQLLILENRRLTARIARKQKRFEQFDESVREKVQSYKTEIRSKDQRITALRQKMQGGQPEFTETMMGLLEMRSPVIASHSMRVAAGCKLLAQELCDDAIQVEAIEIAATLHDIGKIGISEQILNQPFDALTPEELNILRDHPVLGQKILRMFSGFSDEIKAIIRSHHEHYDGSGYPDGLGGEQIPLGARIIAVVNAYDNMCYSQTPGIRLMPGDAINRLKAESGTLYSPEIVECYLFISEDVAQQVPERPIGVISTDELEEGMVLARDLYTVNNLLLLPMNTVISKNYLERIQQYQGNNRPAEIYVFDSSQYSYPTNLINMMVGLLEMRSPAIANHSRRVAADCKKIAQKICTDLRQVKPIEIAAKLHDIGKIGISEQILNKPFDALTPEEFKILQTHPVLGQKALRMFPGLTNIRTVIRAHHENYDGSGYPDGLRGEQIPLAARIIAVVDAYGNMCYSNSLNNRFTPGDAMNQLKAGSGTLYSPEIVECYWSVLMGA